MRDKLTLAELALGWTLMAPYRGCFPRYHKVKKQSIKCRLPRCDVMTTHNGGYCSPEHCKEHRGES